VNEKQNNIKELSRQRASKLWNIAKEWCEATKEGTQKPISIKDS